MIVKRNRPKPPATVRRIVSRSRPTIGESRPRLIVHRDRAGVIGGSRRGPRFRIPTLTGGPPHWMLWAATAVSVVSVLGYAAYWTWTSPIFKVSNVEVVGNERIATSTIVEKVGLLGESMFDANLASAQEALYRQPLVNSVRIERDWPHSIRVVVEERTPWGTWEQSGVQYTIDREGVVLGQGPAGKDVPVIKSSELGNRVIGDRVDYQAVDAAAEIYEKLPRQLGTTVAEVAFIAGKGVQVTTTNNQTALFGDSSSITYKLSVWAALAQEAQARRINYTTIDLRYGNRPVLQ